MIWVQDVYGSVDLSIQIQYFQFYDGEIFSYWDSKLVASDIFNFSFLQQKGSKNKENNNDLTYSGDINC